MNLNQYLEQGVRSVAGTLRRYYLNSPDGRRFLATFLPALQRSAGLRGKYESQGQHIPPFLIASIASHCNLHCAGCYARAGGLCGDTPALEDLTAADWRCIFEEAAALGISFILLAGGEPLLRRDVLETAAYFPQLLFPVFTNGTLLDDSFIGLFSRHRNLFPVLSLDGDAVQTEHRRGPGIAEKLEGLTRVLSLHSILYGISVTVSSENLHTAVTPSFVNDFGRRGCGAVFYVEYVPAQPGTERLALDQEDSRWLCRQVETLKVSAKNMAVFAFPGDEKYMEGCLAAGRGFFHINPAGGAEPCPFSPYSALNVKEDGLLAALTSPFFTEVQRLGRAEDIHSGCTLFNHEQEVRQILRNEVVHQ